MSQVEANQPEFGSSTIQFTWHYGIVQRGDDQDSWDEFEVTHDGDRVCRSPWKAVAEEALADLRRKHPRATVERREARQDFKAFGRGDRPFKRRN